MSSTPQPPRDPFHKDRLPRRPRFGDSVQSRTIQHPYRSFGLTSTPLPLSTPAPPWFRSGVPRVSDTPSDNESPRGVLARLTPTLHDSKLPILAGRTSLRSSLRTRPRSESSSSPQTLRQTVCPVDYEGMGPTDEDPLTPSGILST